MGECEICGVNTNLIEAIVSGVKLKVCKNCAGTNNVVVEKIDAPQTTKKSFVRYSAPTISQRSMEKSAYFDLEPKDTVLIEDFGRKIKSAREQRGLTQEEFAKKINEHISVIHNLEIQKHKPTENLARKIEKSLKIRLYEEI